MSTTRQFLSAPIQTGMLRPSSGTLARAMVKAADVEQRRALVEFGPGTGVVTQAIDQHRHADSQFFSIELNPNFASQTRSLCPGVAVYEDNAVNVAQYLAKHGLERCDAIISSLPWTLINAETQLQLVKAINDNLEPGGVFVTYLYRGTGFHPAARRFLKLLETHCAKAQVAGAVWNNLPPARVFIATKPAD